jgi:hypothetical protein
MAMPRQSIRARRLSVVVAAADTSALEETLVSVLENRPDDCDVIVSLGVAYDDPWNIRDEVTFIDAPRAAGLVGCVSAGVAAAAGDVIHVLASGWRATPGWTDAAMRHFSRPEVAAVVPLAVAESDRDQPVSAGVRRTPGGRSVSVVPRRVSGGISTGPLPHAPALEAGFWRADLLHDVGFSSACGDALAAADMAAAISALRADVVLEPEARVIAGPPPRRDGGFRGGLRAERLFWRSLSCERVVPALVAHAGEVMRHAAMTAPFGTLGTLAGRLAGLLELGSSVARTRRLAALRRQASRGPATEPTDHRTYRIDAPHDTVVRPHVDEPAREFRRSA